jgi:hypothetical protein
VLERRRIAVTARPAIKKERTGTRGPGSMRRLLLSQRHDFNASNS